MAPAHDTGGPFPATRISAILEEYGDIAGVMEIFGVQRPSERDTEVLDDLIRTVRKKQTAELLASPSPASGGGVGVGEGFDTTAPSPPAPLPLAGEGRKACELKSQYGHFRTHHGRWM